MIYLICNNWKYIYFLNVFSQIIHVVSIFSKLPFRGIATNRVTFNGSILSCWKNTVYQNTVVKSDETSTYQELYISENAYQNTTIRWLYPSIQHKTCIRITTIITTKYNRLALTKRKALCDPSHNSTYWIGATIHYNTFWLTDVNLNIYIIYQLNSSEVQGIIVSSKYHNSIFQIYVT